MKLYIDTASNQKTTVKVGRRELVRDSSVWRSQVVLPMIEELLKEQGKTLKDITVIEINPGPGSFTGLRVGAAIANALGFALGIPVKGTPKYN
ncbi:tRNA (adenosine(37)-N6)-threonylcarbamoyltransferase complex dimerization subunit type 1 TsaB [Patescibacteria group bacterium]|nr:tRNA (adenosine(37)-N6)-threonylcarbamoyltransferase complex dimerization subunit type 1 TsaB [Patescibacteria group bacterium]